MERKEITGMHATCHNTQMSTAHSNIPTHAHTHAHTQTHTHTHTPYSSGGGLSTKENSGNLVMSPPPNTLYTLFSSSWYCFSESAVISGSLSPGTHDKYTCIHVQYELKKGQHTSTLPLPYPTLATIYTLPCILDVNVG